MTDQRKFLFDWAGFLSMYNMRHVQIALCVCACNTPTYKSKKTKIRKKEGVVT